MADDLLRKNRLRVLKPEDARAAQAKAQWNVVNLVERLHHEKKLKSGFVRQS